MATTALCGKAPVGQIESMPQHGIRVVFATDPEGRLSEDVRTVLVLTPDCPRAGEVQRRVFRERNPRPGPLYKHATNN